MGYESTVYTVLIASPNMPERQLVQKAIWEWNIHNSKSLDIVLLPVMWETHAAPQLGEAAQDVVNKQIVDNCDMAIALFWDRIGSPTKDYDSGTIEEIERMIDQNKLVMLYFSDMPLKPSQTNPVNLSKVQEYQKHFWGRGLCGDFSSADELDRKLKNDLLVNIREHERKQLGNVELNMDIKVASIVGFDQEGEPIYKRDFWKNVPLNQFQREALLYVRQLNGADPIVLRKMFGRDNVKNLFSYGMLKLRGEKATVYDDEINRFISKHLE
jgi:nucleoside 2-deoxyribosyltransferase